MARAGWFGGVARMPESRGRLSLAPDFCDRCAMKYIVDTKSLIRDGVISEAQAEEIAQRSRDGMIALAINMMLFCGVLAVVLGAAAYLDDLPQLTMLGAGITVIGAAALYAAPEDYRLLSNAVSVIGAGMFVGGAVAWSVQATESYRMAAGLGLPIALGAYLVWIRGPRRLAFLAGWMVFLGAMAHLTGLLAEPAHMLPQWLLYHYAAAILVICGVALDFRLITALAIAALAAALSSRSFYDSGVYAVVVYESTLTIVQMGCVAILCLLVIRRWPGRPGRHAEILGRLGFIWMNIAFWIGSIWGDTVGYYLWGPRWSDFSDIAYWRAGDSPQQAFRAASERFHETTLVISSDVYALVWAVVIVATGVWAALGARRVVFNTAVTFGAIHLYTQFFERFDASPGVIIVAGLIAIAIAYGVWRLDSWIKTRRA